MMPGAKFPGLRPLVQASDRGRVDGQERQLRCCGGPCAHWRRKSSQIAPGSRAKPAETAARPSAVVNRQALHSAGQSSYSGVPRLPMPDHRGL